MSDDILDQIYETLTFYSAGLGEEITVPVEPRHALDELQFVAINTTLSDFLRAYGEAVNFSIARGGIRWPTTSGQP